MVCDKRQWPRCLLWHCWLPQLNRPLLAARSVRWLLACGDDTPLFFGTDGDLLVCTSRVVLSRTRCTVKIGDRDGNDAAEIAADF